MGRKRYTFTETGERRRPLCGEYAIDEHGMVYRAGPKAARRQLCELAHPHRIVTISVEDVPPPEEESPKDKITVSYKNSETVAIYDPKFWEVVLKKPAPECSCTCTVRGDFQEGTLTCDKCGRSYWVSRKGNPAPEKRIDLDTPYGKLTVICDPSMPPDRIALVERRLCPEQTRFRQSARHLRFSSVETAPEPLKPCPFCGGVPYLSSVLDEDNSKMVEMAMCCCCGINMTRAAWNRRVTP